MPILTKANLINDNLILTILHDFSSKGLHFQERALIRNMKRGFNDRLIWDKFD